MLGAHFKARDLQYLGAEFIPGGHLPSKSALVFVENHDRQSNCHVPDPEEGCKAVTVQDGDLYKVEIFHKVLRLLLRASELSELSL